MNPGEMPSLICWAAVQKKADNKCPMAPGEVRSVTQCRGAVKWGTVLENVQRLSAAQNANGRIVT